MERVKLPDMPETRAQDFKLDDKHYARVIYTLSDQKPDRIQLEFQAFEVDADGYIVSVDGAPNQVPKSTHVIATAGLGTAQTLKPGWVHAQDPGTEVEEFDELPAQQDGIIKVKDNFWVWDRGVIARIQEDKAMQLKQSLDRKNTPLIDYGL